MPRKPKEPPPALLPPPAPGLIVKVRQRWYRPGILVGAALVAATTIGAPYVMHMLPELSQRAEYRLQKRNVHITQPPHWVPHNLVEQVWKQAGFADELPLLEESLAQDLAEAFQLNPWVEEVVAVTKSFPAAVQVKLNYRRPIAMVQVKAGMYPVDGNGVLLPPGEFSVSDTKQYPLIVNVHSTPQGPAGNSWGDKVVIDAAKLASVLAPHWKKFNLLSIACPRTSPEHGTLDEGVFSLIVTGGTRIIWGHAPGTNHPGELPVEKKIGRLEKYIADYGDFDRPHGPYLFDIRHFSEISRTRLSVEREESESRLE